MSVSEVLAKQQQNPTIRYYYESTGPFTSYKYFALCRMGWACKGERKKEKEKKERFGWPFMHITQAV